MTTLKATALLHSILITIDFYPKSSKDVPFTCSFPSGQKQQKTSFFYENKTLVLKKQQQRHLSAVQFQKESGRI